MSDSDEPRLLSRVRDAIRTRHFSRRTELAYVSWIRRFVLHHGVRHPRELGEREVAEFLTHLAVRRAVSSSTQNQALAAILFLYRDVLETPLGWAEDVVRAKRPHRVPVVLTREEVTRVVDRLVGQPKLVALLLYGSGLRLMEALRLRVKDVDFERHELTIRGGKGDKDRKTVLPLRLAPALRQHLERVRALHARDLAGGGGAVELPGRLADKLPSAAREWGWQWVFPAQRRYVDHRAGVIRRHHLHETVVQRAVRDAGWGAG